VYSLNDGVNCYVVLSSCYLHLKYQFQKTEIEDWYLTWALQYLNSTWRRKVKSIFEPDIERNDTPFLLCVFSILIDIQNEVFLFDKCIHRTVNRWHAVWAALVVSTDVVHCFIHFWLLNQGVGSTFDSVLVEKYIVQITNHWNADAVIEHTEDLDTWHLRRNTWSSIILNLQVLV
jgi:hypothetical protein